MTMRDTGADNFLNVALVGLSSRSRAVLDMFFSTQAQHLCRLVDDLAQAQVGIVDLDGPRASATLAAYRREFQGPTLALSVRDPELADAVWVAKPVKPTALLAALKAFSKSLAGPLPAPAPDARSTPPVKRPALPPDVDSESTVDTVIDRDGPAGQAEVTAPAAQPQSESPVSADATRAPATEDESNKVAVTDGDPADVRRAAGLAETERRRHPSYGTLNDEVYRDPKQRHRCFYEPRDYLQGALQKALAMASDKQVPVRIKLPSGGEGLTIFPGSHVVQTEIREHLLRSLAMVQGGGDSVTFDLLSDGTAPTSSSGDARLQTEFGLLWKVALWTSLGRVPNGADPQLPVSLLRWPNFTRIFISRHAIPIATLWAQRPTSLLETAQILEIEHRYVFSFYAAASAVGIVEYADRTDREQVPAGGESKRGILGRLLTYLGARD